MHPTSGLRLDVSNLSVDILSKVPRHTDCEYEVLLNSTPKYVSEFFQTKSKVYDIDTTKFDEECKKRYGKRTCILFQCDLDKAYAMYELRTLDDKKEPVKVNRRIFSELIPELVCKKYTVVVVEYIQHSKDHDITSVHTNEIRLFNPILLF
ncbi:hypothetical protein EB118_10460 [bacterium]|nr:hypothetical protein [bacterium]NDD83768.1 hypothetical protein [bacterium]NDG30478.1 hypothetical protein [bacterium]